MRLTLCFWQRVRRKFRANRKAVLGTRACYLCLCSNEFNAAWSDRAAHNRIVRLAREFIAEHPFNNVQIDSPTSSALFEFQSLSYMNYISAQNTVREQFLDWLVSRQSKKLSATTKRTTS